MNLHVSEIRDMILNFDREQVKEKIVNFIRNKFEEAEVRRAIIGVSGGVDSSVAFSLTVKALGKERVTALIMPYTGITPEEDLRDAIELVSSHGVDYRVIDISSIVIEIENSLSKIGLTLPKEARGNLLARSRMILLYSFANSLKGLVVGTGDKSELLIGYFTKYGDGGVDILPIGDLYKTQVRAMALHLGLPKKIALKPSSPRLWPGQLAEKELGLTYEVIDPILYALANLKMSVEELHEIEGLDKVMVDNVVKRIIATEHKRKLPPIPKLFTGLTAAELSLTAK